MRYYCETCLMDVKKKSKYSHLKSKSHKEFEKFKHIILSLKIGDIKDIDEILYLYMTDHNKKYNHCLLKGQFKLVFNNNQDCKYILTSMIDYRTYASWSNYLREVIDKLKEEGYHFIYRAEMDIITLAHKRDMTYDFYINQNMSAIEWKLNAMINKDKSLINNFPRIWRHPIITRFDCYRKNII